MTMSGYFKRIMLNGNVVVRGAVTLRTVLCGLFIALIALFFTSPVNQRSAYDKPLPLPAELGLEELTFGIGSAQAGPYADAEKRDGDF
jgi:hypothetical protein